MVIIMYDIDEYEKRLDTSRKRSKGQQETTEKILSGVWAMLEKPKEVENDCQNW